jgi:hypothetical protein
MKIVSCESGEEVEAVIEPASDSDLKRSKRERSFGFDWTMYGDCDVYKLRRVGEIEILGLMAIQEQPQPGSQNVEIKAIQANKQNIGSKKKYDNIAGCLIAYACQRAFEIGCDGYVLLESKTILYEHYIVKYGFVPLRKSFLVSKTPNSKDLVRKYLEIK